MHIKNINSCSTLIVLQAFPDFDPAAFHSHARNQVLPLLDRVLSLTGCCHLQVELEKIVGMERALKQSFVTIAKKDGVPAVPVVPAVTEYARGTPHAFCTRKYETSCTVCPKALPITPEH